MSYQDYVKLNRQYVDKLLALYRKWVKRTASRRYDRFTLLAALGELVDQFQKVAEPAFEEAYRLGHDSTALSDKGFQAVQRRLASNRGYLSDSFSTDVFTKVEEEEERDVEAVLLALLLSLEYRVEMYGQPHWVLIWEGMEEQASDVFRDTGTQPRVEWLLDETISPERHCNDCPVYAKVYPSWQAMITFTGGVPGDSNSECDGGCRCGVRLLR